MKIIIDRFEEDMAIIELENLKTIAVPKELFKNANEGDIFKITFDKEETEKQKQNIKKIVNDLFID